MFADHISDKVLIPKFQKFLNSRIKKKKEFLQLSSKP